MMCVVHCQFEFFTGMLLRNVITKASREIIRLDIRAYLDPAPNP